MLRLMSIPFSLLVLAVACPSLAQDSPFDLRRAPTARIAPSSEGATGVVTATPEMWFYEQERIRHDDPKMAVRRRAELRGQQRQDRLASLKWYGLDNSRPYVSVTPWFGSYSSYWGSNSYDPLRWRTMAQPLVVQRPGLERY